MHATEDLARDSVSESASADEMGPDNMNSRTTSQQAASLPTAVLGAMVEAHVMADAATTDVSVSGGHAHSTQRANTYQRRSSLPLHLLSILRQQMCGTRSAATSHRTRAGIASRADVVLVELRT